MKSLYILMFSLFTIANIFAQEYNPIALPDSYRSADNPYYWANKKPFTDYWQQDVSYKIHATIDEKTDIIHGKEQLTYWNNSPDTLNVLYFHLYQNAFQPGSYYDNLYHENGIEPEYSEYESQGLGTEISYFAIDGKEVKTELDNTVMIVHLNAPLLPNTSIDFDILFKTFYGDGSVRRRMKYFMSYGKKQYNGAHWYPRIACYDRKFGWTTDQHLGKEFYADFGTFDVTLNFANDYIVAATGKLLNEAEVLPDTLREKLAIENFKDKTWGSDPSTIVERKEGERKKWHFYAENIHDFCFTANPHYRIGEHEWVNAEGRIIKTYSFAQEPHASKWQDAAEYSAKVIQVYSEDIGMYGYHKMIVADARDGMEYPMITLDSGKSPTYKGLLAHEIGHNWFYGMMNNNETYRAFMDEGFTQFLTAWSQEKIDGVYTDLDKPKNNYVAKFRWDRPVKDDEIYYGYMRDACLHKDPQLNTHSDGFHGALRHGGGYGHVYYKTATMLYNLQYTLGDSLFLAAMQNYFDEWSFCHPYPEDFRNSIIRYTKVDLNWYFDQWLETNKTIDYAVEKVKKVKDTTNTFEITLKRNGRMQMPIDFEVMDKEGRTFDYYIPNQYFKKETNAETLPKWTGWDKLNPTYTAKITLPEAYEGEKVKIKKITIDPSEILADNNILSNRTKGNIQWHFDAKVWNFPDWKKYHIYYRPDIWWNAYDGFKLGWHMNGNYMERKHKFWFTGWYNTRLFQGNIPSAKIDANDDNKYFTNDRWSYNFWYETALDKFMPDTKMRINSRFLDGLVLNQFTLAKYFNKNVKLSGSVKSMIRPEPNDINYLLFPEEWETKKWNNSVNIEVKHWFDFKNGNGEGIIDIDARASVSKNYNYHYIQGEYKGERQLWRLDLDTRVFGRMGVGENAPFESSLYFAGANGEEMVENKYVRARGFYPNNWLGYGAETNHFHYGGGLNMRGYAGYQLVEEDKEGNPVAAYKGNSGVSTNIELGFDRIVKWKKLPKLKKTFDIDTYLFADAGTLVYNNSVGKNQFSTLRFDAGVGTTFTIKKWWKLYNVKPLTIRFDVPFYISHAPNSEKNVQFRWVLSVKRAF